MENQCKDCRFFDEIPGSGTGYCERLLWPVVGADDAHCYEFERAEERKEDIQ